MNKNKIAHVDYLDYSQGDDQTRARFIKEFGDSFSNMGFAIVKNHGVTEELRAKLFEVSKKFQGGRSTRSSVGAPIHSTWITHTCSVATRQDKKNMHFTAQKGSISRVCWWNWINPPRLERSKSPTGKVEARTCRIEQNLWRFGLRWTTGTGKSRGKPIKFKWNGQSNSSKLNRFSIWKSVWKRTARFIWIKLWFLAGDPSGGTAMSPGFPGSELQRSRD